MKKQKESIEIVIKGVKGSGRTTLLNIVGSALKTAGLNVTCRSDMGEVDPHPVNFTPDDRQIMVVEATA